MHYEAAIAAKRRQSSRRRRGKRILIVEDDALNRKLLQDLLAVNGYSTVVTDHGLDALVLARECRPDLILMDIGLPEVSGIEVTRRLKADGALKAIPVMAVTACAMPGDEERIRACGCEAYISKPMSIRLFLDSVQRLIGKA